MSVSAYPEHNHLGELRKETPIHSTGAAHPCAKKFDPFSNTSETEAEIDQSVYHLYGLPEEEIAVVKFG